MKNLIKLALLSALFISGGIVLLNPALIHAADARDFNPGRIIDDEVFYNSGALTANQIQTFLSAKSPNCDTNGTRPASDWGYPNITHAQFAEYKRNGTNGFSRDAGFHAPPYTCLSNYSQATPQMEAASGYCTAITAGTRTAAQIIKDVANACGINPAVLVVLLEKEQSLVTDSWPLQRQYKNATGFACPDTAPCDPAYGGFFYQVYHAARQFKVYKAFPNSYNYVAKRNNYIYWNPNYSCGNSSVYIENQATAALYIYTPYRPNQAALNNLYGSGDGCSSYGNRNFWRIFTDWFGSTQSLSVQPNLQNRYAALGGLSSYLGKPVNLGDCGIPGNGCYQNFQYGHIYWSAASGAWDISGGVGDKWIELGAERSYLGYPTNAEVRALKNGGAYQQYQVGRIYWSAASGAWDISGGVGDKWIELGAENSIFGYPTSSEIRGLKDGGAYQKFQIGRVYWSATTGANPISGGIGDYWLNSGAQNSTLGYPKSGERVDNNGRIYQEFEGGIIYWTAAKGAWGVLAELTDRYNTLGSVDSYLGAPYTLGGCGIRGDGCYQNFINGNIYWSPATGAWDISGGIGNKWVTLGAERSTIGYPTAAEVRGLKSGGAYQSYQNGRIYWTPATNAVDISGDILTKWEEMNAENSPLGYPTATEVRGLKSNGAYQQFQIGRIYWTSTTGAFPVSGGIGDYWRQNGAEKSTLGYPTSGEQVNDQGQVYQQFEHGTIYWTAQKGAWS